MSRLNPVAKHAKQFNRCQTFKDRKKAAKDHRKRKHKGKE